MAYYLFSAVHRCQPCKILVGMLDNECNNWKDIITYIDVDSATAEQKLLISKLQISRIPSISNDDELIQNKGFLDIFKIIKALCIKG